LSALFSEGQGTKLALRYNKLWDLLLIVFVNVARKGEMAMKLQPSIRKKSSILILFAIFVALAVPAGTVLADVDDPGPIIFKVINESQFEFTLWLYGPNKYEITVQPYSEESFFFDRGWYAFTMFACNESVVGTWDLRLPKTMHVPVCGSTAGHIGQANQHIDASDYIRPVEIKIRNRTMEPIEVYIRTLTDHHFLSLEPLETQFLTVRESETEYVYSFVACDKLRSGYFMPNTVPLDLTCDK